jgi:hypothetical protein
VLCPPTSLALTACVSTVQGSPPSVPSVKSPRTLELVSKMRAVTTSTREMEAADDPSRLPGSVNSASESNSNAKKNAPPAIQIPDEQHSGDEEEGLPKVTDESPQMETDALMTPTSNQVSPSETKNGNWARTLVDKMWFDQVILVLIVSNTVTLAMETPCMDRQTPEPTLKVVLQVLDYFFTAAFTLEMWLKMRGWGVRAYLRDNKVDFAIVVLSDLGLLIELVTKAVNTGESKDTANLGIVRTVRVFRVLRPLLIVSHFEGMQLILYSIAKSAVSILNVILLLFFVWTIFSIIAMNILMGKMYYCTDASVDTYEECTGTYIPVDEPPVGQTSGVRYGFGLHHKNIAHAKSDKAPRYLRVNKRYWVRHGSHFDNFYSSIVTLNEMSSFQEWPVVAWNAVDTVDEFHGPKLDNNLGYMVFFVLFIMISQYLFFNLFIGVIFTSFSEVKASKMGTHNMTRRQQSWLHVCQMIAQPSSRPIHIPPLPPDWPFRWVGTSRRFMYRFVLSKQVDYFISACIGANVVVLAMKHADETQERTEQLEFWNLIFSLIFIAEAVIKILAINFRTYWAGYWNRLDLVLVILSLLDLVVLEVLKADAEVRAFGALRVLRIFRLVRKSKQVKMLFEMIQQSWSYLMNSIFLYLLLLVMFSILAMNMFGDLERGRYLHDRAHFETFPTAMCAIWSSLFLPCASSVLPLELTRCLLDAYLQVDTVPCCHE